MCEEPAQYWQKWSRAFRWAGVCLAAVLALAGPYVFWLLVHP